MPWPCDATLFWLWSLDMSSKPCLPHLLTSIARKVIRHAAPQRGLGSLELHNRLLLYDIHRSATVSIDNLSWYVIFFRFRSRRPNLLYFVFFLVWAFPCWKGWLFDWKNVFNLQVVRIKQLGVFVWHKWLGLALSLTAVGPHFENQL